MQWLETILGLVGLADGLAVVIQFTRFQLTPPSPDIITALWPFPGLYFIELCLACGAAFTVLVIGRQEHWLNFVPWITAGILLAFNILGALSIGPFLIPATLAFLSAAIIQSRRLRLKLGWRFGLFLLSGLIQFGVTLFLAGHG